MKLDISKLVYKFKLTKTEEEVLAFIINNLEKCKKLGVRGVAASNYTSTATVMNLAKKMGYLGFTDMLYNLNFILNDEKNATADIDSEEEFNGIDLDKLLSFVENNQVNEFIDLLIEYKKNVICICAEGFSRVIGEYINKKLLVLGFITIFTGLYEIYENNPLGTRLVIIISKSGETEEILKICNLAKNKGIKIVSFTGEQDNSVAKTSDINFKVYDMHKLDDRNILSNSFFPNVLMMFEFLISKYLERI